MKRYKEPQKLFYVTQVLKGIKRRIGTQPTRRKRLPITPSILKQLKKRMGKAGLCGHDKAMFWCASLFAFYGFLRVSEYTNPRKWDYKNNARTLTAKHISHTNDHIHITLKKSKTDQARHGNTITLARNRTKLCPVRAYEKYIRRRGIKKGPFFVTADGAYLTPQRVNTFLKATLPVATHGVFSSHSFRIGAASSAATQNYPNYVIQQLGRWSSDCYRSYVQLNADHASKVSRDLAKLE
jgi:hypothetical protein